MKKIIGLGIAGLLLSACAPRVPVSNPGVGFGDFATYEMERAQREAQLTGTASPGVAVGMLPGAAPVTATALPPGGIPASDLAAAGIGSGNAARPGAPVPSAIGIGAGPGFTGGSEPLDAAGLGGTYREGVEASPGNVAPVLAQGGGVAGGVSGGGGGISDEQDFDAVSARESIESDAARLAQAAAEYQVIAPTALPTTPQQTGPNIVQYALTAPNRLGQEYYSRFALSGQGRFLRNCAAYRSPDEAQRDFLARGGPDRDPRGIDPDGDGFACAWDPAPFLLAVGNG